MAIAREALRTQRWSIPLIVLAVAFGVFGAVYDVVKGHPARLLIDVPITIALLGFLIWEVRRRPRLRAAERKNREMLLRAGAPG